MKTPVWAPVALICSVVVNALLLSVYFSADESTTAALLGKQDGVGPPAREDKLMFLPDKYHFVENSIKRILYSPAAKVLSQHTHGPPTLLLWRSTLTLVLSLAGAPSGALDHAEHAAARRGAPQAHTPLLQPPRSPREKLNNYLGIS